MTEISENMFENRDTLLRELHAEIVNDLSCAIDNNGVASMLLSGGTTPGPLYKALSETKIEWDKTWFSATDERWVEPDHIDSNEKLIRSTLLKNNASNAHYIGLKTNHPTPQLGQHDTEENFSKLPLPFDVVLLGMGEDGHVASLFPNLTDTAVALDESRNQLCRAIHRNGDVDRMTVTLRGLKASKKIILLFYGNNKMEIYNKAKLQKTDDLPVSHLLHQSDVPISLYWAE